MSDTPPSSGPLQGFRVLELAHVMAGPVCGLMLADLGAEVIKIERAQGGDPARKFVPPAIGGQSAAFMMLNRNKKSVAIDLKQPRGRAALRALLADADALVENYRPGALARLGLDYESLAEEFPRLVYGSISGYGSEGPLAAEGGFDLIAQGYSGLMSITGEGPGRPPVKVGVPLTDIGAGMLGALGVTSALLRRNQTGRGQRVDTSLFEAGLFTTFWQAAITLATGESPGPMGSAHPLVAPYRAFATADGWITVGTSTQANWERLPSVLGLPELLDDERFADNAGRVAHREELAELIQQQLLTRNADAWIEELRRAGIPAGPVLGIAEALAHEQSVARAMVTRVEHPQAGPVATLGPPVKFSESPASVRSAAPALGQHTRELLGAAGWDAAEIDDALAEGAVAAAD